MDKVRKDWEMKVEVIEGKVKKLDTEIQELNKRMKEKDH